MPYDKGSLPSELPTIVDLWRWQEFAADRCVSAMAEPVGPSRPVFALSSRCQARVKRRGCHYQGPRDRRRSGTYGDPLVSPDGIEAVFVEGEALSAAETQNRGASGTRPINALSPTLLGNRQVAKRPCGKSWPRRRPSGTETGL